jgi:hypothetical protein
MALAWARSRNVLYGMGIIMAVAAVVALSGLRSGVRQATESQEPLVVPQAGE